ncbi:hypothetical protein SAY86_010949 [Trapa natans]|uniref:PPIase cyclophilin-type domain-containing protein n=1 Tax=Trapa natans TaxID=22666 RepID=A0AAN7LXG6_TRANT|nr:hypothetical protein SAY86_010949 [Trapa natans]
MSTVYVLEPPTKGKVVLKTTHGPLDIELWPKEAPKAVRNFVQLCLEGYYDNTIFHRIIKEFLIQGGDPTGSGTGGESIYGHPFGDEYHSRLRFKHWGLVACANAGKPNSNGSQFFITLDRCDWLDRKNTIFGKVTGDSIFNLSRLVELETDSNDRPLDPPPKIISVEVLYNPFEDIVPRVPARPIAQSTEEDENKAPKKRGVKKLNVLSFGEEAEEDEKELATQKIKIKSSHDVLDDPRLLKDEISIKESESVEGKTRRDVQLSIREALGSKKEAMQKESECVFPFSSAKREADDDEDEASFDARMRRQILDKRKELGNVPPKPKSKPTRKRPDGNSSKEEQDISAPRNHDDSDDDNKTKVERLSLNKKGIGSEARAELLANADADLQLLNEVERGRQLNKQKKRRLRGREDEVLAKLERFKASTFGKPAALGGESGVDNEDLSDWRDVRLKFAPETGKDRMSRREDPNDYVVVDPLLEKGKEKFNRLQAKEKRRNREWAGKSLT